MLKKLVKVITQLKCDRCDERKPDVIRTICPYAKEINEEDVPTNLCTECYRERAEDV